jgi:hypothetical protein
MSSRLVALDEGSDITLDRTMVVVGRHPACDTRLDSLRVSRHHCCMTQENGEVVVRDLGSTNGIRINGQRVEIGRLRPGDELSIAHIRYRLENGQAHEQTLAEPAGVMAMAARQDERVAAIAMPNKPAGVPSHSEGDENALAAAVRKLLPVGVADKCRIQVIVQMSESGQSAEGAPEAPGEDHPQVHSHDRVPSVGDDA